MIHAISKMAQLMCRNEKSHGPWANESRSSSGPHNSIPKYVSTTRDITTEIRPTTKKKPTGQFFPSLSVSLRHRRELENSAAEKPKTLETFLFLEISRIPHLISLFLSFVLSSFFLGFSCLFQEKKRRKMGIIGVWLLF